MSSPAVWPIVSKVVAQAMGTVRDTARASVPDADGYVFEVPSRGYLHVESVLLVHGPDEIPGAEDTDVTVLFEVTPSERNSWVRDQLEEEVPRNTEIAHLSIDFETGGWERPPTPVVLPSAESETDHHEALAR